MLPLCLLVCAGTQPWQAALASGLSAEAVRSFVVGSADAAMTALGQWACDAVVVVREHDGSAERAVRRLKAACASPVVVVADSADESAQWRELEAGAAAVLSGAPSPRLVSAQLRRLLSADATPAREVLRIAGLHIDPHRLAASVGSLRLDLSEAQFELLFCLASRAGRIVSRDVLHRVLRLSGSGLRRADTHVYWIRRRLAEAGADGVAIETVHGRGYCLMQVATEAQGTPAVSPVP